MRMLAAFVPLLGSVLAACGQTPTAPAAGLVEPVRRPPSSATAPLVTSACAQRIVRSDDEGVSAVSGENSVAQRRVVAFANRCRFPIRVLFATQSHGRPTSLTEMLQPGETSDFTRIEDGFEQPGYVVCRYEGIPPSSACRLGRTGR